MDNKLKVLWFCNVDLSDTEPNATGTWLHTMADALIKTGEVELYNITLSNVRVQTYENHSSLKQWMLPNEPLTDGLPSSKTIEKIRAIVSAVNPDLIHIWGTENYWGLLSARGYIKGQIILEIQGLKFVLHKYFYAGLSFKDVIKCISLKEIIKPKVSIISQKKSFKKWGEFEKEMLVKHNVISTQSDWVRSYVKNENNNANIISTSILLRKEFLMAKKWDVNNCVKFRIFTIASGASYKGLHVLLDSVSVLKKKYPEVSLIIAGKIKKGIREGGYSKWLKKRTKELNIVENVNWVGSLNADSMVGQIHQSNVVVIPSFLESYSLAFDESLTVGAPTVTSFSGALPELAIHEKTTLFYPPGDAIMCASAISKFFDNESYASMISQNAYDEKKRKHKEKIINPQLDIYRKLLKKR